MIGPQPPYFTEILNSAHFYLGHERFIINLKSSSVI